MKRFMALITAMFVMLFSLNCLANGFSDMPSVDSQYYKAFEYAVNNKIINGAGGKLSPEAPLTKAEALTFISRVKPFTVKPADLSAVTDISGELWYYSTIAQAVSAGLITPVDNTVTPTQILTKRAAWDLLLKALGSTDYTPITNGEAVATRGDFICWIYELTNKADITTPTEIATDLTESPSEAPTEIDEYSALKSKAAQEAMQVALGVRADGTSYVTVNAYRDYSQTDWASGKITSSSSSSDRPSRPSRPSGGDSDDDDEGDEPTEDTNTPTEPPTEESGNNPTNPPAEEETEAPTAEPTYGEYDGPIDNDKDNVIDDPFDDGWTPPGSSGGNSGDGSDDSDDGGSGGWDEEDDFDINDDDDPDYEGDSTEKETEAPSDNETEVPTENETEAPSEPETDIPTDVETDVPTDSETDVPTDVETEGPTDGETDVPTDVETEGPTDGETDIPTDVETEGPADIPSQGGTDNPADGETDVPTDDQTPSTKPEDDEALEEGGEQ